LDDAGPLVLTGALGGREKPALASKFNTIAR
jgi:hypothetical protein